MSIKQKIRTIFFMDKKVIRNTQKKISQSLIYRKRIMSGTFTNSKIFSLNKFALLETMLLRCFSILSSYKKFHEETFKSKKKSLDEILTHKYL